MTVHTRTLTALCWKSMPTFTEYATKQRKRFEEELFEFLKIPSISTLPDHKTDMGKAAAFVQQKLQEAGLDISEVIEGQGHPLVYGESEQDPNKPTILFYGHYDVQPVDPVHEWISPPFEPTVRDGQVYARGASDDKGQLLANIKALDVLHQTQGHLPVNVKVLVEGEEEVGGESITAYIASNPERLAADIALVSDTSMYMPGIPTICTGLRGMVYMEWIAQGTRNDLHSGLYGGVAPNAIYGLVELLAKCKDSAGHILIPGFYDAVKAPSPEETKSWNSLPFDEQAYLSDEVQASVLTGERSYSVFERVGARPTFEIHGIPGGFTGPGAKTVIPARASAKVSVRLVPNQDPGTIYKQIKDFIAVNTPSGITIDVQMIHTAPACLTSPEHPMIQTAAEALKQTWGRETVYIRSGGSIPVVGDIQEYLGIPTILMGYGLPDDGLHAPNEKFNLENFHQGIASTGRFLELLADRSHGS